MFSWNVGLYKLNGQSRKHFKTWSPPAKLVKLTDGTQIDLSVTLGKRQYLRNLRVTSGGEIHVGKEVGDEIEFFLKNNAQRRVYFSILSDTSEHKLGFERPSPSVREQIEEVLARDTSKVRKLKSVYHGHCQITGEFCLDGVAGDITEAHHIKWLSNGGADDPSNMIIVSPDYHRAIHAVSSSLEWEGNTPVFVIGERRHILKINKHLKK